MADEKFELEYYKKYEWIKRLMNYWEFDTMIRMEIFPFEIYEFDFGNNIGSEFSGRHYGVALNYSNEENPLICVAPLKTYKEGKARHHSIVLLGKIDGLATNRDTCCCINQIVSLDKMRIFNKELINKRSENDQKSVLRLNEWQIKTLQKALKRYFTAIFQ